MNRAAVFIAFLLGWITGRASSIGNINFQVAEGYIPVVTTSHQDNSNNNGNGNGNNDEDYTITTRMTDDTNELAARSSSLNALEHSKEHHTFSFDTELRLRKTRNVTSTTDTVTPFHRYMTTLGAPSPHDDTFAHLPQWNSWLHYFEAYHNHMARFRGKEKVVFMEIGVQSGGKIPVLRKYFGPGLVYVGIDINNSTKMFETDETDDFTVHIEIGDSSDPAFLNSIKEKYPHVDIFLDDGGHTMEQQITAMKHMLPHVQPEGVYMCEDLGTSWIESFGGVRRGHVLQGGGGSDFVKNTTVGFIHQTMDWFMAPANSGRGNTETRMDNLHKIPDKRFDVDDVKLSEEKWWKTIPSQVKHIHYYNQVVVYEKGVTYKGLAWKTIGQRINYYFSGEHEKVDWKNIMGQLDSIFGEGLL